MPTTEELRLLFKSLDDHDHTISYKELIRALETEHGATRRFGDTPAEAAAGAPRQKRERGARPGERRGRGGARPGGAALRQRGRAAAEHRLHTTTGQLFSWMDEDRGDHITLREFERGLAGVGIRPMPTTEELRLLFESLDCDHDHTIRTRSSYALWRPSTGRRGASATRPRRRRRSAPRRRSGRGPRSAPGRRRGRGGARPGGAALRQRGRAAEELRRKHLATGLVFNFMDADRGDSIGFGVSAASRGGAPAATARACDARSI